MGWWEDLGSFLDPDAAAAKAAAIQAEKHNRELYKSQSELAALQLNEGQRSDAIAAFQQKSAADAALASSGLEGGTPFWAAKMQADEAKRKIGVSLMSGENQMTSMAENAGYNERQAKNQEASADRAIAFAPINAAIKLGTFVLAAMGNPVIAGALAAGKAASDAGATDTSGGSLKGFSGISTPSVVPNMEGNPIPAVEINTTPGVLANSLKPKPMSDFLTVNESRSTILSPLSPAGGFSWDTKALKSPFNWILFNGGH